MSTKALDNAKLADIIDATQATDVAISIDAGNDVNALHDVRAQNIRATNGVFDSLGNVRTTNAGQINYDNSVVNLGVANIQGAIEKLGSQNWEPVITNFMASSSYAIGDKVLQALDAKAAVATPVTAIGIWIALKAVPAGAWDWKDVEGGSSGNNYWRLLSGAGRSGSGTVRRTTAAALSPSGPNALAALTAGYATIFSEKAAAGTIVVVTGGSGSQSIYNGNYLYDGVNWVALGTDLTDYIKGSIKLQATDADPVVTDWPTGSLVCTTAKGKREIRVRDSAGNLIVVYNEEEINGLIAASRTFKGTVVEPGVTKIGSLAADRLPQQTALTQTDIGSYWVYVGTAGHVIVPNDMGGAPSAIDGLVLQSGDWIMVANVGVPPARVFNYVLIHGDNLGRAQADSLFGHQIWAAGAWETGSIVRYQASTNTPLQYYRASSAVIPGDPAPGAAVPGGGTNKWVNITPTQAISSLIDVDVTGLVDGMALVFDATTGKWEPKVVSSQLADLTDVDSSAVADGDTLVFDAALQQWSTTPMLTTLGAMDDVDTTTTAPSSGDSLVFDGTLNKWKPQQVGQPMVYFGLAAFDPTNVDAAHNWGMDANTRPNPAVWTPAIGDLYICTATGVITQLTGAGGTTSPLTRLSGGVVGGVDSTLDITLVRVSDLADVDVGTTPPINGDSLVWNGTTAKWEPKKITSPIIYLGTGAWVAADVNDAAKRYGMAVDTVPDPAQYAPIAGDQYIDLATGQITTFTGAAPTPGSIRSVSGITGGNAPPAFDMLKDLLIDLRDVDLKTVPPAASDVLTYDGAKWIALAPTGYSQAEIDTKLDSLVVGLSHETAVINIVNAPPTTPVEDEFYIVGTKPTGDFTGHAGDIAYSANGVWRFQTPVKGETRLVEQAGTNGENWHFNGTIWVKVANASAAPPAVASMSMVGDIKQSWLNETEFNGLLVAAGEANKWVLADGRDVTGTDFARITGLTNVPDLRGAYLRVAGQNNNHIAAWNGGTHRGYQDSATAAPKTAFTVSTNGDHTHTIDGVGNHTHSIHIARYSGPVGHDINNYNPGGSKDGNVETAEAAGAHTHTAQNAGGHTHTVTGGDAETRPSTFSVNTFIKVSA